MDKDDLHVANQVHGGGLGFVLPSLMLMSLRLIFVQMTLTPTSMWLVCGCCILCAFEVKAVL